MSKTKKNTMLRETKSLKNRRVQLQIRKHPREPPCFSVLIFMIRCGCKLYFVPDYIFFFIRNCVFGCLLFGQAVLVFSEFIFNRLRQKNLSVWVWGTFSHFLACPSVRGQECLFVEFSRTGMRRRGKKYEKRINITSSRVRAACSRASWERFARSTLGCIKEIMPKVTGKRSPLGEICGLEKSKY